ncbi:MAG: membrane protein insertase YidC, partial [Pseudohongiella sp.]|nr:membrane protein insertase YidC [Pseudohongiella sp.]
MDYIKYTILAALAVVSYLLLLAWQEDYPPVTPVSATQAVPTLESTSDIPATNIATTTLQDIPVVNVPGSSIAESS